MHRMIFQELETMRQRQINSEAKIVSDDIRGCGIEWWLRSPGKAQDKAVYILGTAVNYMGNDVDHALGVRPAIRVRYAEQTAEQ